MTTLVYLAVARYTTTLQDLPALGSGYWPATGVAVGALLVSPRRSWPAILTLVVAAQVTQDISQGYAVLPVAGWAAANVVGHLGTAWLIERWQATSLADARAASRFLAAVAVASLLSGLIGVAPTRAAAGLQEYSLAALDWMVGDGLGVITITPLVLVLGGRTPRQPVPRTEFVLVTAAVVGVSVLVLGLGDPELAALLGYLVLLPMVWAAMRMRLPGAAMATAIVANVCVVMTALDRGAFPTGRIAGVPSGLLLHLFLASVSVTTLLLAVRSTESVTFHEQAEDREYLLAAVSHELRTPLTPIVGFSELLLDRDDLDERTNEALRVVHRNGKHLTRLIDNLLLLSRPPGERLVPAPERLDLASMVRELLHDRGDTDITFTDDGDGVVVDADPEHLARIVTNLVDNARRYGQPPISAHLMRTVDAAQLTVEDAGVGVADWFSPRLFDVFAQESTGDQRASKGLGLGLPISRDLAEANGGTLIHAGGARFVLALPVADTAVPDVS